MVLFGVTGDLSRKKVMPAIYDLANRGLLPPGLQPGRLRPPRLGQPGLREDRPRRGQAARPHRVPRGGLEAARRGLPVRAGRLRRRPGVRHPAPDHRRARRGPRHRAATTPSTSRSRPASSARSSASSRSTASPSPRRGRGAGWSSRSRSGTTWSRRASCNAILDAVFPAESIFRIDHYLGKETVQNILATALRQRDVRADLELQLRRPRADHDGRGHRHRRPGRLLRRHRRRPRRDPEPPAAADGAGRRWRSRSRSTPTACASRSTRCSTRVTLPTRLDLTTARGQYAAGWQGGDKVPGFLEEEGIRPTPPPRRSPRSRCTSTTGAGPACRSTCARASGSGAG